MFISVDMLIYIYIYIYIYIVVRAIDAWPSLGRRDAPVVAIVTCYFYEKIAVDSMIGNKITYFRDKGGGKYNKLLQCYKYIITD